METNNTAVLDCKSKMLNLSFNGESFEIDMSEGDLEDNWNSFTMDNGTALDVNLHWEYPQMEAPRLLTYDYKGQQNLANADETVIELSITGTHEDYFGINWHESINA